MPLVLPDAVLALGAIWTLLVALGLLEAQTHRARLREIPVRIHVNGTRGKSSVVRLLATGLRANGISTCAKTTGTFATFIDPDGLPVDGDFFTAERRYLDVFEQAAGDRGSRLHGTGASAVNRIDRGTLDRFRYKEHAENVALALDVCEHLGADRDRALEGMIELPPDAGATRVLRIDFFGRELTFVNAFAANDPDSTQRLWEQVVAEHGQERCRIAIINCRADRPDRSTQLATVAASWSAADHHVLMGSGTFLFVRTALRAGIPAQRMLVCEHAPPGEVVEATLERARESSLIVGMCNIHGGGHEVARWFANRAEGVEEP